MNTAIKTLSFLGKAVGVSVIGLRMLAIIIEEAIRERHDHTC